MDKPHGVPDDIWQTAVRWAGGEEYAYESVAIAVARAVLDERERCVKFVTDKHENHPQDGDQWDGTFYDLAEDIRSGKNAPGY